MGGRLEEALAAIDSANAEDPVTIEVRGGRRPKEVVHAELMTEWVQRLDPDATEAQLLAARAAHLRRWAVPRSTYPEGRAGYLRWRRDLQRRHAEEVAGILEGVGYDPATIARVQQLVTKRGLGSDPAVQVHEDALCLVFLETQLTATAAKLGAEKLVEVVRKTTRKMSPQALEEAKGLPLDDEAADLVASALSGEAEAGGA